MPARIAGAKLKEMGGKVGLCVNQEVGNVSLDLRCKGFAEGFGGKVTVLPVSNDPADIRAKVKAALAADASIDTILALGAGTAGEPSVAAVKEAGKTGAIRVATFDMSAELPEVGRRAARRPSPSTSSNTCRAICRWCSWRINAKYGLMPGGNVPSGPNLITKEKAAQVVDLSAKGIR